MVGTYFEKKSNDILKGRRGIDPKESCVFSIEVFKKL